jgi:hypothetical protein
MTPEARSRYARDRRTAYEHARLIPVAFSLDGEAFGGPILVGHLDLGCIESHPRADAPADLLDSVPCPVCVLGLASFGADLTGITTDAEVRNVRPDEPSGEPGPGVTPDAALAAAWAFVDTVLIPADRKADIADVTRVLAQGAWVFVQRYEGDFAFVLDLRNRGRKLSDGQVKGVLNVMRAERFRSRKPAVQPTDQPTVPEGHYAVVPDAGANDLAFYRVDRPETGKWAGRVFVKAIIGGRPAQPVRGESAGRVLAQIVEQGVEHSAQRYGTALGRCYRCNKTLTDDESRARGIGPECVKRV